MADRLATLVQAALARVPHHGEISSVRFMGYPTRNQASWYAAGVNFRAMISNYPRVLIFDSGVGGLSILKEVHRQLPWCQFFYACDNRAFPYGTKREDELVERVDLVLKALINEIDPDIIVIACNTASTVALPRIRSHFLNPVVGVVPAIKPAAQHSTSKVIGLLATPGTATRPYTQRLIDEFASDCTVIRVGSSDLVELAEAKIRGGITDTEQLKVIISPLFNHRDLDTVVLACTHFPLLGDELRSVAPRSVRWIDSGEAIARRVASLTLSPVGDRPASGGFECWLTADGDKEANLYKGLKSFGASLIRNLDI